MTTTPPAPLTDEHVIATVKIERPITVGMITSVLCTAIEGGIGYWSYAEGIMHEDVPESIDSIGWRYQSYVLDIGTNGIGEGVAFPQEVRYFGDAHKAKVTYDTIVTGIERILTGDPEKIHLHPDNCAIVASAIAADDPGDIDAAAADWIVQAGLFGEVVYG
jgi:hypothetical protein